MSIRSSWLTLLLTRTRQKAYSMALHRPHKAPVGTESSKRMSDMLTITTPARLKCHSKIHVFKICDRTSPTRNKLCPLELTPNFHSTEQRCGQHHTYFALQFITLKVVRSEDIIYFVELILFSVKILIAQSVYSIIEQSAQHIYLSYSYQQPS